LAKGPGGGDDAGPPLMAPRTMAAVVFAKLVLVPACNLGLVYAASCAMGEPDELMLVVMATLGASPTAMNMSTIVAVTGRGVKEMGTMLFWQYILASVSMTLFATAACLLFVAAD
jgi:hypothetical protein